MEAVAVAAALGHGFSDPSLLQTALTHRSHSTPHNERLEFLGDGVLNLVVATMLYERFAALPEGDLSRLRASLVKQDALHQLAQGLRLGEAMRFGEGELRSGGHQRPSILADALEALFGAIFLDGGFEAANRTIRRLYDPLVAAIDPKQSRKDPKTRLQEWLQGRKKPLPRYVVLDATGAAHAQSFQVACELESPDLRAVGQGTSRRAAEQMAAENILKALNA